MKGMKHVIECIPSRTEQAEERIRELEDKHFEISQSEENKNE